MSEGYALRKWLEARDLLSSPDSRILRVHLDRRAFGGSLALWHGTGCVCDDCVAAEYACWCRNPWCDTDHTKLKDES